jgi:hypothetical protein
MRNRTSPHNQVNLPHFKFKLSRHTSTYETNGIHAKVNAEVVNETIMQAQVKQSNAVLYISLHSCSLVNKLMW